MGAPIYAHLGYSGGLGVFGNASGGFYIHNAFNAGLEYPFQVRGAFCNAFVALRHTSSAKPSYDPMFSLYAGRYFSEAWYKVAQGFSVGTYIRTTRNVYALSNRWVVYPSFGVRYAF